jgi:hypothetical protein
LRIQKIQNDCKRIFFENSDGGCFCLVKTAELNMVIYNYQIALSIYYTQVDEINLLIYKLTKPLLISEFFLWYWDLNSGSCSNYHLSHTLSTFCFSYFWNKVLCIWLGQFGLGSSYLWYPHSWVDRCVLPHLAIGWDGSLTNCLLGMVLNCNPPDFQLLISWY